MALDNTLEERIETTLLELNTNPFTALKRKKEQELRRKDRTQ